MFVSNYPNGLVFIYHSLGGTIVKRLMLET